MTDQSIATGRKRTLLTGIGLSHDSTVDQVIKRLGELKQSAIDYFLMALSGSGFATEAFVQDGVIGEQTSLSLQALFDAASGEE